MTAAQTIRNAVAGVVALRTEAATDPQLLGAVRNVKAFQAQRFAGTYADLLRSSTYGAAARFFLDELYSDKDYSARDAQFARTAGGLQTFFPHQVVETAVRLVQLHALTEELDHQMGQAWLTLGAKYPDPGACYARAWQIVGRSAERTTQLEAVMEIGKELERLTRLPGLRMMLRMMRRPAQATNLSSLQAFLESGFDTFATMGRQDAGASAFFKIIRERESALLRQLFSADLVASETFLRLTLNAA